MNLISEAGIVLTKRQDFEKMYTIKIRAPGDRIFTELGRFGDHDRGYFRPRFVDVRRISGKPNQEGSLIQYSVVPRFLSFNLRLEKSVNYNHLIYRVMNGFAEGGVLIFELETLSRGQCGLSIYVTFDFSAGKGPLGRLAQNIFRLLFPAFVHDVIWNHSLCQMKDCIES